MPADARADETRDGDAFDQAPVDRRRRIRSSNDPGVREGLDLGLGETDRLGRDAADSIGTGLELTGGRAEGIFSSMALNSLTSADVLSRP